MHKLKINYTTLFRCLMCTVVLTFKQYGNSQTLSYPTLPEAATLLSQYIQQKSLSGNEKEASEFFANICRSKGLFVEPLNSAGNQYNFSASLCPLSDQKPNIIFLNHIDVVSEGNINNWQYYPFSGHISDSIVWGRGAIDLKGVAIMQLLAIERAKKWFPDNHFPYNITLLCVGSEESNNQGIKDVIESSFTKLNPVVVYGEGGTGISQISIANPEQSFFCISIAEKKAIGLKLSLNINTSGHGSVPPSVYANKVMIQALHRLLKSKNKLHFDEITVDFFKTVGGYEKGIRKFVLRHPRIFKPVIQKALKKDPILLSIITNTISITNINNTPLPVNQIAPEVEVLLDCRLLPNTDPEKFIDNLRKQLHSNDILITVLKETPTAPVTEKGEYYTHLKKAIETVFTGSVVLPVLIPAHSDNNFLRKMGVPVYGLTPALLSNTQLRSIHNSNEHITFQQLQKGIEVYENLLKNITTHIPESH
ncbi:MAG: M20/M25/M40 family metallo-hydrolase [Bacteroidetes bacterium]|nr:M20/M25/M40 family metallo-hydrolase [Bacteroidota bacterium]